MPFSRPVLAIVVLASSACVSAPHASQAPAPTVIQQGADSGFSAGSTSSAVAARSATAAAEAARTASRSVDSAMVSSADVASRAKGIFGATVPQDDAAADATATGPSWDMEVTAYETQDRVEHYVRYFTGPARERITERLEAGSRYEPMIRARMREGGLPEDMYYLALVESGFDPNAYSRAAAVGMWQFMTSTGRDMGLRVDWWVDERRDPVKSTSAAVRFIRGLRDQFGSLYLAAAAYNGGPGRIARGLSRFADDMEGADNEDRFFVLAEKDYLKNETKEYVPQLIAAALVAKDPARYGMSITAREPFTYDSVRVAPLTPLAAIAKAADTTLAAVQELNPQVLRGMTPPGSPLMVRIPKGRGARFDDALLSLDREERAGAHRVETRKGLSLDQIADDAGIRVRDVERYNPGLKRTRKGRVIAGQLLLVPTPATVRGAVAVPDPSIERYGSSKKGKTVFHVVRRGETLSHIARKYHTTVPALLHMNHMRKKVIFPGQELVVAGGTAARGERSSARKAASEEHEAVKGKKSAASKKTARPAKKAGAAKKAAGSKKPATSKKAAGSRKSGSASKHASKKTSAAPAKRSGAHRKQH